MMVGLALITSLKSNISDCVYIVQINRQVLQLRFESKHHIGAQGHLIATFIFFFFNELRLIYYIA